jgi:membrane-bound lytic murein transglycosylase F
MVHHYSIKIAAFLVLAIGIINPPVCRKTERDLDSRFAKTSIDLPQILKRKKLVALIDNSSTSYFIYKGEPMGFEYEMLSRFAKHLGVELKIVVAKDMDKIFDGLYSNDIDIIAANLTITEDRMNTVEFTEPLLYTRQVLVQRKPKGWENMNESKLGEYLVRTTIDLDSKDIYVRKGSSFYSRLKNLQQEIAGKINIVDVAGNLTTENLIAMVANGKISYTVSDENTAMVNQNYYPQIDIKTAISFPQKIAWAVRKNSPRLVSELNDWILSQKQNPEYAMLYSKYFKSPKSSGARMESMFSSVGGNKISCYDDMIIAYSREIGWDWRLLASMIYQESKFNPNAQSWAGACGLMQMIPATAVHYGIDSCDATPIASIDAGTRHLIKLDQYWVKFISNKDERTKFVLASYNVGLGHIIDARNLAKKYGKNSDVWFDNVELLIVLKSTPKYYNDPIVRCGYCRGQEPYNYVREIMKRYEHYKNVIKEPKSQDLLVEKI